MLQLLTMPPPFHNICYHFIGSKVTDLSVINSINRYVEPPLSGAMCDLLWADPLLEEILGKRLSDQDYKEVR